MASLLMYYRESTRLTYIVFRCITRDIHSSEGEQYLYAYTSIRPYRFEELKT
jgi:hypothetical protein